MHILDTSVHILDMAPPLHWWCLVQTLAQVKKKPLCLNKPGADNVQSVSFRANSPVMEFCLIVFNLKISLTRAQTQLWYFCVLSQFCSAESWLEPDRSNALQKALRWGGGWRPCTPFPFYFNVCFMNCHYRLKRGVDEGPLLTPFPPQLLRENGCLPKTDCSRYIL